MNRLMQQICRFGVIGGVCFLIDYGIMIGLTELVGVDYLISSGVSFTISVVVNYILSMRFVFQSKESANKGLEFLVFVLLSIIGLGLNELLMWSMVRKLGIYYMFAKIAVTAVVMVYNFISRKLILEDRK